MVLGHLSVTVRMPLNRRLGKKRCTLNLTITCHHNWEPPRNQNDLIMKALQTFTEHFPGHWASKRSRVLSYVDTNPCCTLIDLTGLRCLSAVIVFGGTLIGFCLARTIMMNPANLQHHTVPGEIVSNKYVLSFRNNHSLIKENGFGTGSACINPASLSMSTYQ